MTDRLDGWRAESELLSSLRELSIIDLVRAKAPTEIAEKRAEAEGLLKKAHELLAEVAHIEGVLMSANAEPKSVVHPLPHFRPDMAEAVAA